MVGSVMDEAKLDDLKQRVRQLEADLLTMRNRQDAIEVEQVGIKAGQLNLSQRIVAISETIEERNQH